MMTNLLNRQTVPPAIATVCFVPLALAAPTTLTVLLATASVVTLALALWRWWSFGRDAH